MNAKSGTSSSQDDVMLRGLSEAVLANFMALRMAGISEDEIKIIVGPDGGTVVGAGIVLQTPLTKRLPDAVSHQFRDVFRQLHATYQAGKLDSDQIAEIIERHNVSRKVDAIRSQGGAGTTSL